jgi:serine/threonine-protein kinase HipA
VRRIADLLRTHSTAPAEDVDTFVGALVLGWLIGGTDAHAKNYSLLSGARGVRLAPLYDVASILAYDDVQVQKSKLAMKIGGKYRLRDIGEHQWSKLAKDLRLDPAGVHEQVAAMARALPDHAMDVLRACERDGAATPLVAKLANRIARRAQKPAAIRR